MRKPRSDSKLLNLPHHQQDRIIAWLLDEGLSYADTKAQIHLDFGLETSEAALGTFWERVCAPRQFARVAEASEAAPALAEGLENNFVATTEAYVRQHYFVLLASRYPDPEVVAIFAKQIADLEKSKIAREQLEFDRQKHAETNQVKVEALALSREKFQRDTCALFLKWVNDEKAKAIAGSGATNAEKIEQLGQAMFGEDWTQ